jgi:uncharacterized membrane protein
VRPFALASILSVVSLVYIILAAPDSTERSVLWIVTSLSSLALKWVIVDPIIALFFPTTWRYWSTDEHASDSAACCCVHCLPSAFLQRGKVADAQGFSTVGP